ncbi:MAG: thymidine phosphorylase, partial [Treponema sp.]|nr:thymidine phosphorylase [Treponema sp.]
GPDDVMELTLALGSRMLYLGGKAQSVEEGISLCKNAVSSGKALEVFLENVREQGADPDSLMANLGKRRSKHHAEFKAEKDGYLLIDAYKTGISCIHLGVGRNKTSDAVDPDSGIVFRKRQGDFVRAGETLMDVYARDEKSLEAGMNAISDAVSYSEEKVPEKKLILKEIK